VVLTASCAPTPQTVVETVEVEKTIVETVEVEKEVQVEPEVISTGPYLEVVDSGAHIPLVAQPELLVGRLDEVSGIEPEVDMTPHGGFDAGVSRRHAKIHQKGNRFFIEDVGSANGTFLNGQRLTPYLPHPLQKGDHRGGLVPRGAMA